MYTDNKTQAIKNLCTYTNTTPTQLLTPYNKPIPNTNLNQKELFIALIRNETTTQQNQYIQTVCNLPHKDWRTPHQYARELTITWLLEDLTQTILTQHGIKNRKNGADQHRQYLPPHQIDKNTDLQIKHNQQTRNLETIYDHTGHWQRTNQIDLRLNKHHNLQTQQALLLGINPHNLTAILINYQNPIQAQQKHHPQYGKTVQTITLTTPPQPIHQTIQQLHTPHS